MDIRRAALLTCTLIACGDDEAFVPDGGIDAGTDAALDADTPAEASCGFDQTYHVDWVGSFFAVQSRVIFSSPRGYTLSVLGADGGIGESCSITLPCGGPGVDAEDIAQHLADPSVVALFSNDGGLLGRVDHFASDARPRVIQRQDGKRILVGYCATPDCSTLPAALKELGPLFEELQSQHRTSWMSCKDWPTP